MPAIQVKLFATMRDRLKTPQLTVELPAPQITVSELLEMLTETYPEMAPMLPTLVVAVNKEFAFGDTPIRAGDEVALFPPVSGGAGADGPTLLQVTADPLDLDDLVTQISRPTTGAVVAFVGTVRGRTGEREVTALHYEAYTAMAEAKLRQVADEIRARWPAVEGIALVQRVGRLPVGDVTVCVAVSAGHRNQGVFEAARYGIDRLKEIVPIWKKEIGPQGETWIEGHYRPTPADTQPWRPYYDEARTIAQNLKESGTRR